MVVLVVVLVGVLVVCGKFVESKNKEQLFVKLVFVVNVVYLVQYLWFCVVMVSGVVQLWQEVSIGVEVNGLKLVEVFVNVGDVVK